MTGKKDPSSDWAVAHLTITEQMLEQVQIGKQLDADEITYYDAYGNPNNPPPIFPDAVFHIDKNHTIASLGGAGHDGSFARTQYLLSLLTETLVL